ncbi:MAG TPA: DUF4139 domain-containing protein [Candidatus Udaeobacter sp.]|nr:DUF4139 domain-containing protein [Candidatus Udaeobacter sp.]
MRPSTSIAALAGVGLAIATAAPARELAVTVYNEDLGVVRDKRTVETASGRSTIQISDVASEIDPTSVHLTGIRAVEQNYAFDLASAEKILHRYLGKTVDVLAEEGRSYRGTLLAYDAQNLVLKAGSGEEVTIVGRESVQDIRCPALPEGLITRPTLIWLVDGAKSGKTEVELSYMTGGMNWHAEYVAVVAADDKSMDLSGWVSVENRSGATYPDAKLKLVAGAVHRATPPPMPLAKGRMMDAEAAAAPQFVERGLFEYHLYDLERPSTIADQEVKQISLFEPAHAPVSKIYEYDGMYGQGVKVTLETENKESVGLGMPLPAGKVRAMKADKDGRLEFVGEDAIDHTPRGEKVKIRMGEAFDVKAERILADHRQVSDRVYEETIEVKLRNRKTESIEVVVVEHPQGSWEILESSHPYEKKEAYKIEFKVKVAPDQEVVVRYKVRVR